MSRVDKSTTINNNYNIDTVVIIKNHIPILKYSWSTASFNKRTGHKGTEFKQNRFTNEVI